MSPRVQRACRQRTSPPSRQNGLARFPSPAKRGAGNLDLKVYSRQRRWPSGAGLESKEVEVLWGKVEYEEFVCW
jgi:hypothetical protein